MGTSGCWGLKVTSTMAPVLNELIISSDLSYQGNINAERWIQITNFQFAQLLHLHANICIGWVKDIHSYGSEPAFEKLGSENLDGWEMCTHRNNRTREFGGLRRKFQFSRGGQRRLLRKGGTWDWKTENIPAGQSQWENHSKEMCQSRGWTKAGKARRQCCRSVNGTKD